MQWLIELRSFLNSIINNPYFIMFLISSIVFLFHTGIPTMFEILLEEKKRNFLNSTKPNSDTMAEGNNEFPK
jgi:hypothetical protein